MEEEPPIKGMISNRDSAVAATICSLLVAVLTWAVLGGPFQNVIVDNGNVADWIAAIAGLIAAIGTWVIGIGANRYARESERTRRAELRTEIEGRLATLITASVQLSTLHDSVVEFRNSQSGPVDLENLETLLDYVEGRVTDVAPEIAGYMVYFPQYANALSNIQFLASNILFTFAAARRNLVALRGDFPLDSRLELWRAIVEIAERQTFELAQSARYLTDEAVRIANSLGSDIVQRWSRPIN